MTRMDFQPSSRSPLRGAALLLAVLVVACDTDITSVEDLPYSMSARTPSVSFESLGETKTVEIRIEDASGEAVPSAALSWESSDPDVVRVDGEGRLEAVGNGTADIHVEVASGTHQSEAVADTIDVHVSQVPVDLVVADERVELWTLGARHDLEAWAIDAEGAPYELELDEEVAWEVSGHGVVELTEVDGLRSVGKGEAEVTAYSGDLEASIEVSVDPEAHMVFCASAEDSAGQGGEGEDCASVSVTVLAEDSSARDD